MFKFTVMKACLAVFLFLASCCLSLAQDRLEKSSRQNWEQKIVGTWRFDRLETNKHWKQNWHDGYADDRYFIPVSPEKLHFDAGGELKLEKIPTSFKYQVNSVGKDEKSLTVEMEYEGKATQLEFVTINDDKLILKVPISYLGPVEVIYTRKPLKPTMPEEMDGLTGEWELEKMLSQTLWEEQVSAHSLRKYSGDMLAQIEKFRTIRFQVNEIQYDGDQTVELIQILDKKDDAIQLESIFNQRRAIIELRSLSDDLLQVADKRRRLFAIYQRKKRKSPKQPLVTKGFPASGFAKSFLQFYAGVAPRKPLKKKLPSVGIDGSVELEKISTERSRTPGGKLIDGPHAKYLKAQLFVNLQSTDYPWGGYLIKLNDLKPVKDNSGRLLLTPDWVDRIKMLKEQVRASGFSNKRDGRSGVNLSFDFESLNNDATHIENLAGELEVVEYSIKLIKFADLRSLVGKPIKHQLFKDFEIVANVKDDRLNEVTLEFPAEAEKQIRAWFLVDGTGERLSSSSESSGWRRTIPTSRGYMNGIPKEIDLWIRINEIRSTKTFPFKFENIKLR